MKNLFALFAFAFLTTFFENNPAESLEGMIVKLKDLKIGECKILKQFDVNNPPEWVNKSNLDFYKNRNRVVYLSSDNKYVVKIWQKNYASRDSFINAYEKGFYNNIAVITALIYDEDNECRGYITPYMTDRTFNKQAWESYGFKLEKNAQNINIFADHQSQPDVYQKFFVRLIENSKKTNLISLDLCPNNVAVNADDNRLYLIDLEDVQPITSLNDMLVQETYFKYLSQDYIDKLQAI